MTASPVGRTLPRGATGASLDEPRRVVLVVPSTTYRAADFLAAARALGVEVVVASDAAQSLAGRMAGRALTVDLARPEEAAAAVAELAGRLRIDAVVPLDDQAVLPAALAARRLGLRHNPPEAVAATRDKAALREALRAHGLTAPSFALLDTGDDPAEVAAAVGLPCVVKPRSLSASRGVIRADDPAAAATAARRVRAMLGDPEAALLVERYVPGTEVAVEGLLSAGRLEVLAVFDKPDPLEGPYFEETIYVTPSRLPPPALAAIEAETAAAAAALGLSEGPVHAELRLPPSHARPPTPVVIELAARTIGGLCSRVLRFGTGVSLERLVLAHALGASLDDLPGREPGAAGVMMLPIPKAGRLLGVEGQAEARAVPGVVGLEITVPVGRTIRPLPEGDRYLGFLFAKAPTPEEVEAALRSAHRRLSVRIAELREPDAAAPPATASRPSRSCSPER
jgi:biotin carboxylase